MKKVRFITNDLKKRILEFLYCNEIYNAILIELIENDNANLDGLYINSNEHGVADILHIKNDGNSDFTLFSYSSKEGLEDIACSIKESNCKKILLAGKFQDVKSLLKIMGHEKNIIPNVFYKLNIEKYKSINMELRSKIRLANSNMEDFEIVKQFTVRFLEAETEEEIKAVSNTEKILPKIKNGLYLLEFNNNYIGMARFIGKSNNYAEITGVYIDEAYRNRGFGKELIYHMIGLAIKEHKTPVLATSIHNTAAMKTYESMGFERQVEYAYEFLD